MADTSSQSAICHLLKLPNELIRKIVQMLSSKDKTKLLITCKRMLYDLKPLFLPFEEFDQYSENPLSLMQQLKYSIREYGPIAAAKLQEFSHPRPFFCEDEPALTHNRKILQIHLSPFKGFCCIVYEGGSMELYNLDKYYASEYEEYNLPFYSNPHTPSLVSYARDDSKEIVLIIDVHLYVVFYSEVTEKCNLFVTAHPEFLNVLKTPWLMSSSFIDDKIMYIIVERGYYIFDLDNRKNIKFCELSLEVNYNTDVEYYFICGTDIGWIKKTGIFLLKNNTKLQRLPYIYDDEKNQKPVSSIANANQDRNYVYVHIKRGPMLEELYIAHTPTFSFFTKIKFPYDVKPNCYFSPWCFIKITFCNKQNCHHLNFDALLNDDSNNLSLPNVLTVNAEYIADLKADKRGVLCITDKYIMYTTWQNVSKPTRTRKDHPNTFRNYRYSVFHTCK